MKKLYNKMINTMNSVSRKAVGTVNSMAFSARTALSNTRGEGYIDRMTLGGRPLRRYRIGHDELVRGGNLVFELKNAQ